MTFETRKPAIGDMYIPFGLFVRILSQRGASEEEIRRDCPNLSPPDIRRVLAYARGLPADLEHRFHLLMHDSYWVFGNFTKARTGKGYWSNYQLRSVRQLGGLQAVKRYLARPQAQDGFDRVLELDLLEYSIEALVVQAPWSKLFSQHELAEARRRLTAVGYRPTS